MKKQINLDSKIISGVEEHRLGLIRELEGLQSAIDGIFSSRNWVISVQKISNKIEELNDLENRLDRDMFHSFGKQPRMNKH